MSVASEDEQQDGAEAVRDDERQGTARVVLRAVRAVVLDDLPPGTQRAVLEAAGTPPVERVLWEPLTLRQGTVEAAIKAYAGPSGEENNTPGTYRAIPRGSWGVSPLVIEPPLG